MENQNNTPQQDVTTPQQEVTQTPEQTAPAYVAPNPAVEPVTSVSDPILTPTIVVPVAHKINQIMAYVLIASGVSFVLIAILAIWQVFGPDAGAVVWRSLGSLGAIALGALIVSAASKLIESNQTK